MARFHSHLLYVAVLLFGVVSGAFGQTEKTSGLQALLDGTEFVRIPSGRFVMGSADGSQDEQPPHRVRIPTGFEMGKHEVTQEQWYAVMRRAHANPGEDDHLAPSRFRGADLPVESVSWPDVQEFLKRMNARDPSYIYRLPTESEWEYACRAGSNADEAGGLDGSAWFEPNAASATHPVGQKQPNAWGLHDMHGNVAEWVADWYGSYDAAEASDPRGPAAGSYRVFRGGSWLSAGRYCRCAARGFNFPNDRYDSVGFRLVRTKRQR